MKNNLKEYLICPICRGKLTLKITKKIGTDIDSGKFSCLKCKEFFPIKNGIPRFVSDKSKDFIKTEDAFSSKWKQYNKSYHNKKWYDFQKKWFIERFNWKSFKNFKSFLKNKNFILDAGTGIGNSAHLLSMHKDSMVFGIDASESIEFAYRKYGKLNNIHFIQADLRQLPFKKLFFDYIQSDQVLHHTKNTETSFKYLTKFLKKGGSIAIYVYNKKAPIREFSDDYIRSITTKMSVKECVAFSKDMAILGKSLTALKKKITISKDIPVLKIKAGTYDVQRFIYWYILKCFWADDNDLQRSIGVNFDWYFPKYAYRHTPIEVKKWFKDKKLKITTFKEIESGISVVGKK